MEHSSSVADTAHNLLTFITQSPTPFHAVDTIRQQLDKNNFQELHEADIWNLNSGARSYVIRGGSSIAAWIQGSDPVHNGFRMIGAHTDSPNLRIKPNPVFTPHHYVQLGVEEYGSVLLSSWMDRDLSLAGRVYVQEGKKELIRMHLIKLNRPLLRIPLLAIHLDRDVNTKGLVLNKQTHLPPIMGLFPQKKAAKAHPLLLQLLADTLNIKVSHILNYDLSLYDLQEPAILGAQQEFLVAPRIDNLFSCFCGMTALLKQLKTPQKHTSMLVCFDHEEIGSLSMQGAQSSFLKNTLRRLSTDNQEPQEFERTIAQSLFISSDMAHAVHPNYVEKHDPQHFPYINQGPVIKVNAQGRYATNGWSSAIFELICKQKKIPVQKFVNRTDLSCGSTIGPFVAGNLGVPAIDIGCAMLSMHSIREMCGSQDPDYLIRALSGVFQYANPVLQ